MEFIIIPMSQVPVFASLQSLIGRGVRAKVARDRESERDKQQITYICSQVVRTNRGHKFAQKVIQLAALNVAIT